MAEASAAAAVKDLASEGLQMSEIAELCGGEVSEKELHRLAKLAPAEG